MPTKKQNSKLQKIVKYLKSHTSRRRVIASVVATGLLSAGASAALPVVSPLSYSHQMSTLSPVTETDGCIAKRGLPDSACTPGAIVVDATKNDICRPGYSFLARNVSEATKNKVFEEYGVISRSKGEYEVDHLVSLELGGSNDISNLWPEKASPTPGFHQKDTLENELHRKVCSGVISLSVAQKEIARNWILLYLDLNQ